MTPLFGSYMNDQTRTVTTPGKAIGVINSVRNTNWARWLRKVMTNSAASIGKVKKLLP